MFVCRKCVVSFVREQQFYVVLARKYVHVLNILLTLKLFLCIFDTFITRMYICLNIICVSHLNAYMYIFAFAHGSPTRSVPPHAGLSTILASAAMGGSGGRGDAAVMSRFADLMELLAGGAGRGMGDVGGEDYEDEDEEEEEEEDEWEVSCLWPLCCVRPYMACSLLYHVCAFCGVSCCILVHVQPFSSLCEMFIFLIHKTSINTPIHICIYVDIYTHIYTHIHILTAPTSSRRTRKTTATTGARRENTRPIVHG